MSTARAQFFSGLKDTSPLLIGAAPFGIIYGVLELVPPTVLTAIVFPELLLRDGQLAVHMDNHRLIAGVIASLVAWRFKKIMPTIVVGMAALWLRQYYAD